VAAKPSNWETAAVQLKTVEVLTKWGPSQKNKLYHGQIDGFCGKFLLAADWSGLPNKAS
jgi:hypothetical protein